jgi:hypothetical protein
MRQAVTPFAALEHGTDVPANADFPLKKVPLGRY